MTSSHEPPRSDTAAWAVSGVSSSPAGIGAAYLHQGESYVIEELHFADYLALAKPDTPEYTTTMTSSPEPPRSDTAARAVSGVSSSPAAQPTQPDTKSY